MNVEKVYRDTKNCLKRVDWAMKNIPKVCTEGCSACCHQSVSIFSQEGLVLERYILSSLNMEQRVKAKESGEEWIRKFNHITPNASVYNPLTEDDLISAERQINKLRIPCLFLEDGRCMVYTARPLVCRTYVAESSPELCEFDFDRRSKRANTLHKIHFRNLMEVEQGVLLRPMVYAVAKTLGITESLKPIKSAVHTKLPPGF